MSEPVYDQQDQYDKIATGLLQGEQVIAVYDAIGAGTGFIGITDRRIVLQDNSYLGKRVALTSVPYSRISAVSYVSDTSMFGRVASSSTLSVQVGSADYEIDFRGVEQARHAHDVILWYLLGG